MVKLTGLSTIVIAVLVGSALFPQRARAASETLAGIASGSTAIVASPLVGFGQGLQAVINPVSEIGSSIGNFITSISSAVEGIKESIPDFPDIPLPGDVIKRTCNCPDGSRFEVGIKESCLDVCVGHFGKPDPVDPDDPDAPDPFIRGRKRKPDTVIEDPVVDPVIEDPVVDPVVEDAVRAGARVFDPHQQLYDPITGAFVG